MATDVSEEAFFVYILRSLKDGNYYIGQTNDITDRVRRHNEGRVRSTKGRRPLVLVFSESCASRAEAIRRERELKRLKSNSAFKKLLSQVPSGKASRQLC